MMRTVREYVKMSANQGTQYKKPPSLLQSQPLTKARWSRVAIDFIVALTTTKAKCDLVLVVVNQLTKPELYRDHIFVLHGVPSEILSDRDPKFTAIVWKTLCAMLGTRQQLSTAFRHQANGVTERRNQIIGNYLRAFTNGTSTDWDSYLSLAEFAYNSRHQESISMSPFEADLDYLPSTPATLLNPTQGHGAELQSRAQGKPFLKLQADRLATIRRELQKASDRMNDYYYNNRPEQTIEHTGTTKQKLRARWIGPFAIVSRLGHAYYELKLTKGVKFHPVFHTS
ncbi:Retrotransposon protein [Phytophthora megakarya]|uniref:Retrotransposon protein n=1 Tax=Phytophthora megakarya TaxID=4795 RepID=A0A225WIK1_9STRA|nr:Retrotransposon protein [Phytophthora megakarya]